MSREKWESIGKDINRKYYHIGSDRGPIPAFIIFEDTYKWAESRIWELEGALRTFLEMYIRLVNSGDAGNWNPENDEEVIRARKALKVD
jgi:hypothetical protein